MSMGSMKKPHAVCIPLPCQGHINPMLKLAHLLNSSGFHITFVHTQFNYDRLIKSKGAASLDPAVDFRFETVSDGLPAGNQRQISDLPELCVSMPIHCKKSFRELIIRLNNDDAEVPPVSCIVSDGVMSFTLEVAQEFGILEMFLFTPSACGMLGYLHFGELRERGYFPLKDESCLTNGYLDTKIDWIPAMEGIRLKELPTFIRSTDDKDIMFNYNLESVNKALNTKSLILNTFDDLEPEVLDAIKTKFQNLYTIGPLSMLQDHLSTESCLNSVQRAPSNPFSTDASSPDKISKPKQGSIPSSLWKEEMGCLEWLDKREPKSVLYVNFGSLVIMTHEQLSEFAWGLANSKYHFLWVIRPDLVNGGYEIKSKDFEKGIMGRGLILDWCPQERVLGHRSVGGFLTHCGWNSILESVREGVPMLCWPFFAEQQTNSGFICRKWGIGMEIDVDVKRKDVEGAVMELMEGGEGKKMREKAMELKILAERATKHGGSSFCNFYSLVDHLKKGSQPNQY